MGKEWGPKEVRALFNFLKHIKTIAPTSVIQQSDAGNEAKPNIEFTLAFDKFCIASSKE